jgi:hypothetical protein
MSNVKSVYLNLFLWRGGEVHDTFYGGGGGATYKSLGTSEIHSFLKPIQKLDDEQDDRGSTPGSQLIFLLACVQTGSAAHSASYLTATGGRTAEA